MTVVPGCSRQRHAEPVVVRGPRREVLGDRPVGDRDVQEAGAGDLDVRDHVTAPASAADDLRRQLPRVRLRLLGQRQDAVGLEVGPVASSQQRVRVGGLRQGGREGGRRGAAGRRRLRDVTEAIGVGAVLLVGGMGTTSIPRGVKQFPGCGRRARGGRLGQSGAATFQPGRGRCHEQEGSADRGSEHRDHRLGLPFRGRGHRGVGAPRPGQTCRRRVRALAPPARSTSATCARS